MVINLAIYIWPNHPIIAPLGSWASAGPPSIRRKERPAGDLRGVIACCQQCPMQKWGYEISVTTWKSLEIWLAFLSNMIKQEFDQVDGSV